MAAAIAQFSKEEIVQRGEALVGMGLLDGHNLNIRVAIGGRVTIESFLPTQPLG